MFRLEGHDSTFTEASLESPIFHFQVQASNESDTSVSDDEYLPAIKLDSLSCQHHGGCTKYQSVIKIENMAHYCESFISCYATES